jgi:hypothetical protein
MDKLTEQWFEKNRLDHWFKFSKNLLCTFEDGKVFISDGEIEYSLDHIKTGKDWKGLHLALTGNAL